MNNMLADFPQSKKYSFFLRNGELKVNNVISGKSGSLTAAVMNELKNEWKLHEDILAQEISRIRHSLIAVENEKEKANLKEISKHTDNTMMTKDEMKQYYESCYYFMTKSMGDGWLIDLENHKFTMIDKSAIADVIEDKDENKAYWKSRFFIGKREYNPHKHSILYDVVDGNITYKAMNTYYLPTWKKEYPKPPVQLDPLLVKFFKHLFPERDCQLYIMDWIANSMFTRNMCYLILIGEKRVGKGLLVDMISRVHRRENVQTRSSEQAYDLYDGDLAFTTVVSFDEITICNSKQYNYLKTFANDYKNYRPMHGESFTANNYANVIITLNKESSISALDTQDGRLSVPKLTSKKLVESFTEEERKRLWTDDSLIENLVSYCFHSKPTRDMAVRHVNLEELEKVTTLAMPNYMAEFLEICRELMLKEFKNLDDALKVYTNTGNKSFKFVIPTNIVSKAIVRCEDHKNPDLRSISQNKLHKFFVNHPESGKTMRQTSETKYKILTNNDLLGIATK
jgi:Family of unknown function (DUF5906)